MNAALQSSLGLDLSQAGLLLMAGALFVALLLYGQQRRRGQRLNRKLEAAHSRLDDALLHDRLTGLRTREDFEASLEADVTACDRTRSTLGVLMLGLDQFRIVNDAFGHASGDVLLRRVAARISQALPGCAVARLAGDEFAVLLAGTDATVRQRTGQLLEAFMQPFDVDGRPMSVGCSIGLALYPLHGARPHLLANAHAAMRAAKAAGGGAFAEYEPSMGVNVREQAELAHELRTAVERRELELVYQPKIDAVSLQITAAEALLRWNHPRRGVVSPGVFIPVAERHGLIGAIGNWVIEEACRQAAEWREQGLRMRVAVNLSGYQVRQHDLVDRIEAALKTHRLVPSRFTCEITESVAMEDTKVTQQAFDRLRNAGVHVSIDDFGTGYSSLASLRRLPAAELKIDRAFVSDLETSHDSRAIVTAVVQMAHSMDLRVVAEGVETEAQRDLLVLLGCDELQGFLFAKPMSAKALALWASDDGPMAEGVFRASLFEDTGALPLEPETAAATSVPRAGRRSASR
jgi:diguanylate cyclase